MLAAMYADDHPVPLPIVVDRLADWRAQYDEPGHPDYVVEFVIINPYTHAADVTQHHNPHRCIVDYIGTLADFASGRVLGGVDPAAHPIDVFLCTHSLYYLQPAEIASAVALSRQHLVYSVHHNYRELAEGHHDLLAGEQRVDRDGAHVHVRVGATDYDHGDCAWLNRPGYPGLTWTGVLRDQPTSTEVYIFTLPPRGVVFPVFNTSDPAPAPDEVLLQYHPLDSSWRGALNRAAYEDGAPLMALASSTVAVKRDVVRLVDARIDATSHDAAALRTLAWSQSSLTAPARAALMERAAVAVDLPSALITLAHRKTVHYMWPRRGLWLALALVLAFVFYTVATRDFGASPAVTLVPPITPNFTQRGSYVGECEHCRISLAYPLAAADNDTWGPTKHCFPCYGASAASCGCGASYANKSCHQCLHAALMRSPAPPRRLIHIAAKEPPTIVPFGLLVVLGCVALEEWLQRVVPEMAAPIRVLEFLWHAYPFTVARVALASLPFFVHVSETWMQPRVALTVHIAWDVVWWALGQCDLLAAAPIWLLALAWLVSRYTGRAARVIGHIIQPYRDTGWAAYPTLHSGHNPGPISFPRVDFIEDPKGRAPSRVIQMHVGLDLGGDLPSYMAGKEPLLLLGPFCPELAPAICRRSQEHVLTSLRNRFAVETADERGEVPAWLMEPCERAFLESIVVPSVDVDAWIAHQKPGVRRRLLRLVADGMLRHPVDGGRSRTLGCRKIFLKTEKINCVTRHGLRAVNPRVIAAVGDEENLLLGPSICAFQAAFAQRALLGQEFNPRPPFCSTCGLNLLQIGELFRKEFERGRTAIFCIDKSNFDATVSRTAHAFEREIYRVLGLRDPAAIQVLEAQIDRDATCTFHVRMNHILGRRNSGDPNTTLGNTLLCGFANARTLRALGVDGVPYCVGDDCVIFCDPHTVPRDFVERFIDHQKECFGFVNKMHRAAHPADIDYMSCRVIPVVVGGATAWRLVPLLGKCLPKLFWSCASGVRTAPLLFARAIADGATHLFAGDPMVTPFLAAVCDGLAGYNPRPRLQAAVRDSGVQYLQVGVSAEPPASPHTDYSLFFEARYGVPCRLTSLSADVVGKPLVTPFNLPIEVLTRDNDGIVL
jgi:hypothetical protein